MGSKLSIAAYTYEHTEALFDCRDGFDAVEADLERAS